MINDEVKTFSKSDPNFKTGYNDPRPAKLVTAAERLYERHLINVKKYQHKNPEKMKLKAKRYMEELKKDKEKYGIFLEKRRDYYINVVKPKREKRLAEAHEALPTTLVI